MLTNRVEEEARYKNYQQSYKKETKLAPLYGSQQSTWSSPSKPKSTWATNTSSIPSPPLDTKPSTSSPARESRYKTKAFKQNRFQIRSTFTNKTSSGASRTSSRTGSKTDRKRPAALNTEDRGKAPAPIVSPSALLSRFYSKMGSADNRRAAASSEDEADASGSIPPTMSRPLQASTRWPRTPTEDAAKTRSIDKVWVY